MLPTITLAAESNIKKEVVKTIINLINNDKSLKVNYKINSLYLDSVSEVSDFISQNLNNKIKKNIIIFLDIPRFKIEKLSILRNKIYIFAAWEDIPEHYHTFYKYAQFIFDGLFIEPGYKSFFEVFGLPTYSSALFYSDLPSFFKYRQPYESLIPLKKRLYDFSFIGRLDRPGRIESIKELKKNFPNVYLHDSSSGYLSNEKLNSIIRNTRYLINSTSVKAKNSYGFKNFPEYLQLQEKSRLLEYAANGCIIFSEILPKQTYSTLNKKYILPVIEIPRGLNKSDFCLDYINNDLQVEQLSKQTYDAAYNGFNTSNINQFFHKILNDLKFRQAKFSKLNLNKIESKIVKNKFIKFIFYSEISSIIRSKNSIKVKLKNFLILLKKEIDSYGFLITFKIILYFFPRMLINRVQNFIAKMI
tara:strand:- start:1559 stop:2809 length:1251 start_codon:yes stop_codon:yes gene_type:complete